MDPKLIVDLILQVNRAVGLIAPVVRAVAKIRDAAGGDFPVLATSLDLTDERVKQIIDEGDQWLRDHPEPSSA